MTELYPLHKNAFFLHSFLDENIGSNIGNNTNQTINEFIKYVPEQYKQNFKSSADIYLNKLDKILLKVNEVKEIDFRPNRRSYQYRYILHDAEDKKSKPQDATNTQLFNNQTTGDHYKTVSNMEFLKKHENNRTKYDISPNADFATEYENNDFFIDVDAESTLENDMDLLINNALNKQTPVFFPIGYPKHLIGLLITTKHIIITNSGQGIIHHNTYNNTRNNGNETSKIYSPLHTQEDTSHVNKKSTDTHSGSFTSHFSDVNNENPNKKPIIDLPSTPMQTFPDVNNDNPNKKPIIDLPSTPMQTFPDVCE
jgi:hypothetical protein